MLYSLDIYFHLLPPENGVASPDDALVCLDWEGGGDGTKVGTCLKVVMAVFFRLHSHHPLSKVAYDKTVTKIAYMEIQVLVAQPKKVKSKTSLWFFWFIPGEP